METGALNAQEMTEQSDHLGPGELGEEGASLAPAPPPVIRLPRGCHLAPADWQGFKSKEESAITPRGLQ